MSDLSEKQRNILQSFASRVDRNNPGALNNLGVLYFRKGMYEEAISQFKEALKIDSRFDLARENLQYLFAETNLEDPDVKHWKKEAKKKPDNDEAFQRLGVSYQNMGLFAKASKILGEVVDRDPDNFLARMHLGNVLKNQGLYQQALEHYLYISKDAERSVVFHTDLGEVYYNLGKTEETITELQTAIKLDGDYWRSHFLLSFAYGDNGNFMEALEESRIASSLNPSFQSTEANLALSDYRKKGDEKMSGIEIPSFESTSFTLGMAYKERGFLKEAVKEFTKALIEMSDKECVYIEIGKLLVLQGQYDEAINTLLKALDSSPEQAEAYRLLGCVYHLKKEYHQAAICYLQAYKLNSADVNAINNLGVLLYQVGLHEEAERMFKKGLNLKLYHMELNYNFLGCVFLKEEYMMAENLIQRLEAFMGKSAVLYEKRALLNYRLNRLTLALFDIESALSLDPEHSDSIYLKGLIFLREEDFRDAVDAIVQASKISPHYMGMGFFLTVDDSVRSGTTKVDSKIAFGPNNDLIKLLQSGINRNFDMLHGFLMSVVERTAEELKNNAISPVDIPKTDKTGDSAAQNNGGVDLLEEIKFEL